MKKYFASAVFLLATVTFLYLAVILFRSQRLVSPVPEDDAIEIIFLTPTPGG